jgi:hypothetical protein
MKNTFKVVIAALTLSTFVFDGCKKGEDDPFMSIHTRKGRMVGDWKVTQGNGNDVGFTGTSSWTYDGTTKTTTVGSLSGTETIGMTYNFEKDGSCTMVTTTTTTNPNNVETETVTGTWNFTGKIGDDKNKDHIVVRELTDTDVNTNPSSSTTTTYTGDNGPVQSMYIDELKNKEIIFKWTGTTTPGNFSSSGQYTLTPQ